MRWRNGLLFSSHVCQASGLASLMVSGNLTAVRSGIGHRISGMSAIDGGANRRFRTDDAVIRGDGQVSRAKHVHHFTSVDFKGHSGSITDLTGLGRSQNLRIAQFDGQFVDASPDSRAAPHGQPDSRRSRSNRLRHAPRRPWTESRHGTRPHARRVLLHLVVRLLRQQDRLFFGHVILLDLGRMIPVNQRVEMMSITNTSVSSPPMPACGTPREP